MGQFFILRSRVQQEYNSLLVNALNRIFKGNESLNNFKWLLTKLELSCVHPPGVVYLSIECKKQN